MSKTLDSVILPPSGRVLGIGGSSEKVQLRAAADGVLSNSEVNYDLNVEGCQTITTLWGFTVGSLTNMIISFRYSFLGANDSTYFQPSNWIYNGTTTAYDEDQVRRYFLAASRDVLITVPTYGMPFLRIVHSTNGVTAGSSLDLYVIKGWSLERGNKEALPA